MKKDTINNIVKLKNWDSNLNARILIFIYISHRF